MEFGPAIAKMLFSKGECVECTILSLTKTYKKVRLEGNAKISVQALASGDGHQTVSISGSCLDNEIIINSIRLC